MILRLPVAAFVICYTSLAIPQKIRPNSLKTDKKNQDSFYFHR